MFKRVLALVITITAVVVFANTLISATLYDPGDSGIVVSTVAASQSAVASHMATTRETAMLATTSPILASQELPDRLKIASLGIDAHIQRVTISKHNTIGVPNNFKDVAWYIYSPKPGQEGSAVIDGHVDNGLALAGVFKHLSDIQVGDPISVTDGDGKKIDFTVIQIDIYPYSSTSTDALSYPKPGSYLRLISCTGSWLSKFRTYDKRIVVTAKLVS